MAEHERAWAAYGAARLWYKYQRRKAIEYVGITANDEGYHYAYTVHRDVSGFRNVILDAWRKRRRARALRPVANACLGGHSERKN